MADENIYAALAEKNEDFDPNFEQLDGALGDFENLHFKSLVNDVTIEVPNANFGEKTFKATPSLITCSSNYGFLVVGTCSGFIITQTKKLREQVYKSKTYKRIDLDDYISVDINTGAVHIVVLSSDQLQLFVGISGGVLLVYNIKDIIKDKNEAIPVQLLEYESDLTSIQPNPYPKLSHMIAVTTKDNNCRVVRFAKNETIFTVPNVSSSCWSSKGRQIACGSVSGTIFVYDIEGTIKEEIEAPEEMKANYNEDEKSDRKVKAISWLKKDIFFAVYSRLDSIENYAHTPYIIDYTKKDPYERYIVIDEINPIFLEEEAPVKHFYLGLVRNLGSDIKTLIITANSASSGISAVGQNEQDVWGVFSFEEPILLPNTKSYGDTYPVGMALDFSLIDSLALSDEDSIKSSIPTVPVLIILNNEGVLSLYYVYNSTLAKSDEKVNGMISAKELSEIAALEPVRIVKSGKVAEFIKKNKSAEVQIQNTVEIKEQIQTEKQSETKRPVQDKKPAEIKEPAENKKLVEPEEIAQSKKPIEIKESTQDKKTTEAEETAQSIKSAETKKNTETTKPTEAKESVEDKKTIETKEPVHIEKHVDIKALVQDEKPSESKELAQAEKSTKTNESAQNAKSAESVKNKKPTETNESTQPKNPVETKESTQPKNPVETKESAQSEKTAETKESAQSEKHVETKESVETKEPAKTRKPTGIKEPTLFVSKSDHGKESLAAPLKSKEDSTIENNKTSSKTNVDQPNPTKKSVPSERPKSSIGSAHRQSGIPPPSKLPSFSSIKSSTKPKETTGQLEKKKSIENQPKGTSEKPQFGVTSSPFGSSVSKYASPAQKSSFASIARSSSSETKNEIPTQEKPTVPKTKVPVDSSFKFGAFEDNSKPKSESPVQRPASIKNPYGVESSGPIDKKNPFGEVSFASSSPSGLKEKTEKPTVGNKEESKISFSDAKTTAEAAPVEHPELKKQKEAGGCSISFEDVSKLLDCDSGSDITKVSSIHEENDGDSLEKDDGSDESTPSNDDSFFGTDINEKSGSSINVSDDIERDLGLASTRADGLTIEENQEDESLYAEAKKYKDGRDLYENEEESIVEEKRKEEERIAEEKRNEEERIAKMKRFIAELLAKEERLEAEQLKAERLAASKPCPLIAYYSRDEYDLLQFKRSNKLPAMSAKFEDTYFSIFEELDKNDCLLQDIKNTIEVHSKNSFTVTNISSFEDEDFVWKLSDLEDMPGMLASLIKESQETSMFLNKTKKMVDDLLCSGKKYEGKINAIKQYVDAGDFEAPITEVDTFKELESKRTGLQDKVSIIQVTLKSLEKQLDECKSKIENTVTKPKKENVDLYSLRRVIREIEQSIKKEQVRLIQLEKQDLLLLSKDKPSDNKKLDSKPLSKLFARSAFLNTLFNGVQNRGLLTN